MDQLGGRLPLPELLEAHLQMVQQLPGQPLAAEHAAVNQGLQPANYCSARSHAQPDVLLSPTGSDRKTADSEPGDKQWCSLGSALDPEQSVSSDSAGSTTPSSEHNSSPPSSGKPVQQRTNRIFEHKDVLNFAQILLPLRL